MKKITITNILNHSCTLIEGNAQQPVLVFLHEGLGCTDMWRDFPKELCATTGCAGLIYDRLGYGASSPLTTEFASDYLHRAATEELPMLLRQVIPETPYILIGHSDGGSIALIHAAMDHPHCRAIITEAAHVFVEGITLDGIRKAIALWESGRLRAVLKKYHGNNAETVFRNWSETWLSVEFRRWNIEELLSAIKVPALILQGADDQYGSPQQVMAIVNGMQGLTSSSIIESCGHTPHREQPQTVNRLMADFILAL